jgi:cytochrome c oxidase assembly factor CtaG
VLGLCCPAASGIEVPVVALLLFVYSTSAMLVTPSYDDINIYFI